jgi:ribonucleoside-triphosphate reductase
MAGRNRPQATVFTPKQIEEKCSRAGIDFWLASETALALEGRLGGVASEEELDDVVLDELRRKDKEAAKKFESYYKVYVRTTEGVLESFDKGRIVSSLVKETNLAQNICEEIANEVESDTRRLELKYVSAPLIREMVNSKLLERRHMQAKAMYTRIGLPIYDVTRIIEHSEMNVPNPDAIHKEFGDAIAAEYALMKLLPEDVSRAHLECAIHVHDLPYFATRPVSLQSDLRWFLRKGIMSDGLGETTSVAGPAKHPEVAFSHAVRVLISGETHLSGGQSLDFFNFFLAPYTMSLDDKAVRQLIQTFLYELTQILAVHGGIIATTTLNFEVETPAFLKKEKAVLPGGVLGQDTYGDYEREAIRLLNLFLSTMGEGDFRGKPFSMPKIVVKVREGNIPLTTEETIEQFVRSNELTFLNLRKRAANLNMVAPNHILPPKAGKWHTTLQTGVLQEVSINLPRIASSAKEDAEFFNQLDACLENARTACKAKKYVIDHRLHTDGTLPFLTQVFEGEEFYSLDNATSIVSVVGLDNAVREYVGADISKDAEAYRFAERVLAYINTKLDSFNEADQLNLGFGYLEAPNAAKRFAAMNEKKFGVREVYPRNGFTHGSGDAWVKMEAQLQQHCRTAAKLSVEAEEKALPQVYRLLNEDLLAFTLVPKRK